MINRNDINKYLNTMNKLSGTKKDILNFIKGTNILDVGPGGGALLHHINKIPDMNTIGLEKSKPIYNKLVDNGYNVIEGDLLTIKFNQKFDTIIFSSVLHEVYSFTEYNGSMYNIDSVKDTLTKAYKLLNKGGRIIIRDFVKPEREENCSYNLKIHDFKFEKDYDPEDMLLYFIKNFVDNVKYTRGFDNTFVLHYEHIMEFLYKYTWGKKSFKYEMKKKYCYFSLSDYQRFINDSLKHSDIIFLNSYLENGYGINLHDKFSIRNYANNYVKLPDSTCFIVIEKRK